MITITIDCASGAEAREHLTALLGTKDGRFEQISIKDENFPPEAMIIVDDPIPGKENSAEAQQCIDKTLKKRRTKAEIDAEKEKTIAENVVETSADIKEPAKEEIKVSAVTKEMLQEKAVNLIRNSKKDKVVEVLKSFGADSIAQADKNPLKVEDYAVVMDELNKL